MTKRQKERIAKLVAALRSGEFKQATDTLRDAKGRMCCLGVACEVYRRDTGKGRWVDEHFGPAFKTGESVDDTVLPEAVAKWYGFKHASGNPSVNPRIVVKLGRSLAEDKASVANDDHELKFKAIADGFERTYLGPEAA